MKSQVVGVETFNKTLDYGEAGDNVGILVRGLTREQMHRGLVMAEPRSLVTSSVLEANIYVLNEEEGGRKNSFSSGYRPQVNCLLYYSSITRQLIPLLRFSCLKMSRSPSQEITLRLEPNFISH